MQKSAVVATTFNFASANIGKNVSAAMMLVMLFANSRRRVDAAIRLFGLANFHVFVFAVAGERSPFDGCFISFFDDCINYFY